MARWGMVIDLDKCVGCGTCMAACRTENNVPVSNKEAALQGRSIFWMDMLTMEPHLSYTGLKGLCKAPEQIVLRLRLNVRTLSLVSRTS